MTATRILLALAAVSSSACAVSVEGDFDGVVFSPTTSAVAILDAHDVFVRDGAFVPVERTRFDKRVQLWLSSASLPGNEEWRRLPSARVLELKRSIADSDVLVLRDIDFDALQDGDTLRATNVDISGANGRGDFTFSLAQHDPFDDLVSNGQEGLGALVVVTIKATQLRRDDPRGGQLDAVITISRERAAQQPPSDLATGDVTITVSLPLADERLAEANFAILAPIASCAAAVGSDRAVGCLDTPADDVIDATGRH